MNTMRNNIEIKWKLYDLNEKSFVSKTVKTCQHYFLYCLVCI